MEEICKKTITVVIATYNRGSDVSRAVETILSNDYPDDEVIVVDQSDNVLTETSLKSFWVHPRFRYLKSATRGVSTRRNLGISVARGNLIAITDDDCEVSGDWLQELSADFSAMFCRTRMDAQQSMWQLLGGFDPMLNRNIWGQIFILDFGFKNWYKSC